MWLCASNYEQIIHLNCLICFDVVVLIVNATIQLINLDAVVVCPQCQARGIVRQECAVNAVSPQEC